MLKSLLTPGRWLRRNSRRAPRDMKIIDLLALTGIFFGPSIASSLSITIEAVDKVVPSIPEFDASANWVALVQQSIQLMVGAAYIWARQIRLLPWTLRPTLSGTALGFGLFAITGLLMDAAYTLYGQLAAGNAPEMASETEDAGNYAEISPSLVVYSILNGFYEEFFFLVICLSVPRHKIAWAFLYSLVVRFSFHTYQGLFSAAAVTAIAGGTFFAASRLSPKHRIYPMVLAHTLSDIFGMGILSLLFPEPIE